MRLATPEVAELNPRPYIMLAEEPLAVTTGSTIGDPWRG